MDSKEEAQELQAKADAIAKDLVQKFNRNWGHWNEEQRSRRSRSVTKEDPNRDLLMNKVCSLFATIMLNTDLDSGIAYVEAGPEKDTNNFAFVVFSENVLAYCTAARGDKMLIEDPKLTLIPRSHLQKLDVERGIRLGADFTYVRDEAVVLKLEYGGPAGRTLQLPLDEKAGVDRNSSEPLPVDVALIKLLPGLIQDLNLR